MTPCRRSCAVDKNICFHRRLVLKRQTQGADCQVARGRPVSLERSSQEGAEAQGTHVRQTLHRLDPALTVSVHMPPAPDVNVRRGGGNNGAPHAFLTSPSIPQSCAPLTFAARRAHRCFVFLLSGAGAEGGLRGEVVFKRAQACCSTAAIEPDPPLSRKRLSSTPQVLVLEAGLTALTPCKRPAVQANRPVCARAGLRVRAGISFSSRWLRGSALIS